MSERKKYPRYLNLPGWSISLLNKIGFVLQDQTIGEIYTGKGGFEQLHADTAHEQLIYQNNNTGSILRRPATKRMAFFHNQTPVEQIDPKGAKVGPFSRKLSVDALQAARERGGNLKSVSKSEYPQSFKFKR